MALNPTLQPGPQMTHVDGFIPAGEQPPQQKQDQNNQQNDQQNQGEQNQEGQDNKENKVDSYSDIWKNKVSEEGEKSSEKQIVEIIQKEAGPTAAEKFQAHMDGLELTSDVDFTKIQEDMAQGNMESFQAALTQTAANTYKNAMLSMNEIIEDKIKTAVNDATRNAVAGTRSDMLISNMETALPFTADPAVQPMARAVLKQFVTKNPDKSQQEQIGMVEKFFSRINGLTNANTKNNTSQDKDGWDGSMNELGQIPEDADVPDFESLLGGAQN